MVRELNEFDRNSRTNEIKKRVTPEQSPADLAEGVKGDFPFF
jgi:hypothetical protein